MSHAQTAGDGSEAAPQINMPSPLALQYAAQKGEETDRPIMMDYWRDSLDAKVMIGIRPDGEKLLVKSASEYTSHIGRIFKVEDAFLVLTENSIYLVSSGISSCNISE
jgi:hypothetical protein